MDLHQAGQLISELSLLPQEHLEALTRRYEWITTARPDQLPPDDFPTWMMMGGRGAGKTRAGAEDTWWNAYVNPQRVAVVGPTLPDVRKTAFEGESGLLARIPESLVSRYNRTSLELWTRTQSGEESYYAGYSAEEPERFRGPQHHAAWCDELGAWNPVKAIDVWDNLKFGLRLSQLPRITITTTPRTTPLVRMIVKDKRTALSRASTFQNTNLPQSVLDDFRDRYDGTRIGRQELYAELLEDVVGALWTLEMLRYPTIEDSSALDDLSQFRRIVVSVDPSGSMNDSIGITVSAQRHPGAMTHARPEEFAVLADRTISGSPAQWGAAAVRAYHEFGADRLVAEVNYGGKMVEEVVRNADPNVSYREVRASRGKTIRAEPIASLYEQGRVVHQRGLSKLEDQMMLMTLDGYVGDASPDRVDSLVWGLAELSGRIPRSTPQLDATGENQRNNARV